MSGGAVGQLTPKEINVGNILEKQSKLLLKY
jgi:hypothetical protein